MEGIRILSNKAFVFLRMIKFEHTLFALPFAYLGMVLGAGGLPDLKTFVFITLAMAGARSFAMALNRIADRKIDAKNPRTAERALPRGQISVKQSLVFTLVSLGVFFTAVYFLPPLCHKLWPVVMVPMALYSYTKRFTWASHFVLGFCLGLAPLGAWVAVTNTLPPAGIVVLGAAVAAWTAGFDIIYSCQDAVFDRETGLFSIPAVFGAETALGLVRVLHTVAVLLFFAAGYLFSLGPVFYAGVLVAGGFLFYENLIIKDGSMDRINTAFFTLNSLVSIILFAAGLTAISLPGWG